MSQIYKRKISGVLLFAFVFFVFSPCFLQPLFAQDGTSGTSDKKATQDPARVKGTILGILQGGLIGYVFGHFLTQTVCSSLVITSVSLGAMIPCAIIGGIIAYNCYQNSAAKGENNANKKATPTSAAKSTPSGSAFETRNSFKDGAEVKIDMKIGK